MSRRMSPLATYERISPNQSRPRTGQIRRNTPHCVDGNLTIERTLGLSKFINYDAKSGASCSYAIGSDGRMGLGVEESNRPWTSSSRANDHEAITFEIANNGPAPDYRISDAAINAWLDASEEIARYYGYKKMNYQPKPVAVLPSQTENWIATWAKEDEMIVTLHTWYNPLKACPGAYFMRQLPWLVKELNRRLSGGVKEAFVGEGASSQVVPSAPTPSSEVAYLIRITASALNVRKGPGTSNGIVTTLVNDKNIYTIVEESNGWGRLKSGIGWLSLAYTKKV